MYFQLPLLISAVVLLVVSVSCQSGRTTPTASPVTSEAHGQVTTLISKNEQTRDVLIIDLGASAYLDIASTDMLKNLVEELRDQDIRFLNADA